jgi:P27 family predicted phage terminase small subunit
MRGRKPTPTTLKKLRGNPGRRPLPEHEAEPPVSEKVPRPPAYLKGEARKFWFKYAPMLWEAGLLTKIDVPILAGAAVSYAQWLEAMEEIRRTGPVIARLGPREQKIPMQNPYVRVARDAHLAWNKALTEFGMSASSRTRVKVSKAKTMNPFELYLASKTREGK